MLNLLQSGMCGSESGNAPADNGNSAHFFNRNLQRSSDLKSQQSAKVEHIAGENDIAYIRIRDEVSSPTPAKMELQKRTHFQRLFKHKYPDFLRHYCMCLHNKIEPDDLNTAPTTTDDIYGANSFLLNRTPIIPITVDPTKYVQTLMTNSSWNLIYRFSKADKLSFDFNYLSL